MRELTEEQRELLAFINTPEYIARKAKEQADCEAEMAHARAIAEERWRLERAKYEAEERRKAEAIKPLKRAMKAAGIKLNLSSYEGVWGSYQISDGPEIEIDADSFNTED